jgi:hypothetical protein
MPESLDNDLVIVAAVKGPEVIAVRFLKEYLKYGGREFWRRQVFGCIGGIIGLPILCGFVFLPLYLVSEYDLGIEYALVPMGLCLGLIAVSGGLFIFLFLARSRRQ